MNKYNGVISAFDPENGYGTIIVQNEAFTFHGSHILSAGIHTYPSSTTRPKIGDNVNVLINDSGDVSWLHIAYEFCQNEPVEVHFSDRTGEFWLSGYTFQWSRTDNDVIGPTNVFVLRRDKDGKAQEFPSNRVRKV